MSPWGGRERGEEREEGEGKTEWGNKEKQWDIAGFSWGRQFLHRGQKHHNKKEKSGRYSLWEEVKRGDREREKR
jgi:hypothetical protein